MKRTKSVTGKSTVTAKIGNAKPASKKKADVKIVAKKATNSAPNTTNQAPAAVESKAPIAGSSTASGRGTTIIRNGATVHVYADGNPTPLGEIWGVKCGFAGMLHRQDDWTGKQKPGSPTNRLMFPLTAKDAERFKADLEAHATGNRNQLLRFIMGVQASGQKYFRTFQLPLGLGIAADEDKPDGNLPKQALDAIDAAGPGEYVMSVFNGTRRGPSRKFVPATLAHLCSEAATPKQAATIACWEALPASATPSIQAKAAKPGNSRTAAQKLGKLARKK